MTEYTMDHLSKELKQSMDSVNGLTKKVIHIKAFLIMVDYYLDAIIKLDIKMNQGNLK